MYNFIRISNQKYISITLKIAKTLKQFNISVAFRNTTNLGCILNNTLPAAALADGPAPPPPIFRDHPYK